MEMNQYEENIEITFKNYENYYIISYENYKNILKTCKNRYNKRVIDDIDFVCKCNEKIENLSVIVIVFSCLCLESYINCYGASKTSKSYFDNYLDKLDLKSKWIVIPKLLTGEQIDTRSSAFEKLRNLIKLRNKLVHDKPRTKKMSDLSDSDWIDENDAKFAIDTVKEILGELESIDNEIDINWINNSCINKI